MIERIRQFREATRLPLYFTLDAGPNIHLLYPEKIEDLVRGFVLEDLQPLCESGRFIADRIGKGPEKLK
jgi:diphosphomevalonate decarboxylase